MASEKRMIPDYNKMITDDLVDLLAHETQRFTQLMMDKEFTSEYAKCKRTIEKIQKVIEERVGTGVTHNSKSSPVDSNS
ncbi:MAG TPA: hypothetical protein VMZ03_08385 [Chitinophagaceae bacterium]|nr:hypothetical protein [Chitinophagaceae bacterium]